MAVDAMKLLQHLSNKDRDLEEDVDVTFIFSHHNFDFLADLAEEIGDLFADKLNVEYDSVVIGYDEHPKLQNEKDDQGPPAPQVTLAYIGPLTADQFRMLHDLASKFATRHEIAYQGVQWWPY